MKGYKIIEGSAKECEVRLNNLRLEFEFEVLELSTNETKTTVLIRIKRTVKEAEEWMRKAKKQLSEA